MKGICQCPVFSVPSAAVRWIQGPNHISRVCVTYTVAEEAEPDTSVEHEVDGKFRFRLPLFIDKMPLAVFVLNDIRENRIHRSGTEQWIAFRVTHTRSITRFEFSVISFDQGGDIIREISTESRTLDLKREQVARLPAGIVRPKFYPARLSIAGILRETGE